MHLTSPKPPRFLVAAAVLGVVASGLVSTAVWGVGGDAAEVAALAETPELVTADGETVPVQHSGDAADEPTIWANSPQPSQSLVIGNDKRGALEVYNLDGSLQQRITTSIPFWGNSDIRYGVDIGGQTRDVVIAYNNGIRVFEVDPVERRLVSITDDPGNIPTDVGEGVCLYEDSIGDLYAFVIRAGKGRVREFRLTDTDSDGLIEGTQVRQFLVGSESEGCVVDDVTATFYVSQEDVGLWRYSAAPNGGTARTLVDGLVAAGGHLQPDVEGLTLVDQGLGEGYLIASAQYVEMPGKSYFVVYDRQTNAYVKSFRITRGTSADSCERTDGIAAYAGDLGPPFPQGLFICQDNGNRAPGAAGDQDFKFTGLQRVVDLS